MGSVAVPWVRALGPKKVPSVDDTTAATDVDTDTTAITDPVLDPNVPDVPDVIDSDTDTGQRVSTSGHSPVEPELSSPLVSPLSSVRLHQPRRVTGSESESTSQ